MNRDDPTIKSKILRELGRRRNKYLKVCLSDDEYALLLKWSLHGDTTMSDIIRKRVFKDS